MKEALKAYNDAVKHFRYLNELLVRFNNELVNAKLKVELAEEELLRHAADDTTCPAVVGGPGVCTCGKKN